MLFCHITSRVDGEKDADLFAAKGGRGFPHLVVLDAEGDVLAVHRASRTAEAFAATVERARALPPLREKAKGGAAEDRARYLVAALPEGALADEEIEALKRDLGPIDEALGHRVEAELARRELERCRNAGMWREALEATQAILRHAPDDVMALESAPDIALNGLRDLPAAVALAERGLKTLPDSIELHCLAARAYQAWDACALALPHLAAAEARLETLTGDWEPAYYRRLVGNIGAALAASGREAYEKMEEREEEGWTETVWKATGAARESKYPREERLLTYAKEGVLDHAVSVLHYEEQQQYWVVARLGGVQESIRGAREAWPADEAVAIARTGHRAVGALREARRLRGLIALPRLHQVVQEGLGVDAEDVALLDHRTFLHNNGWETYETVGSRPAGATSMTLFRPTGEGRPADPAAGYVGPVLLPEGELDHAFVVWIGGSRADAPRYLTATSPKDFAELRRYGETPSDDELFAAAAAAETALPAYREGRGSQADGMKSDSPNVFLELASMQFRDAVRADPKFVAAARQLSATYLAMSDRERDPLKTDELYGKALGALELYLRLAPGDADGKATVAVYFYRFGAYPLAAQYAQQAAGHDRAREILNLLHETGQDAYKNLEPFDLEGFKVFPFERMPAPDESGLEGLQMVEKCFLGYTGSVYRFTASYRVQKLGERVERDLFFSRFEEGTVARVFEAEPSMDELKAELQRVLESLRPGGEAK